MILYQLLIASFVSDVISLPPFPMENIYISSVFHVNDSSVKNIHDVYDSVQTITDKILLGTVSII